MCIDSEEALFARWCVIKSARDFFSAGTRRGLLRRKCSRFCCRSGSSRSKNVPFCLRCCSCRVSAITELFLSSCLLYFLPALVHHPERLAPCARSTSHSHYFFQFVPSIQASVLFLITFLFSAPFFLAALLEFKIEAPGQVGSLPQPPLIASSQIHFLCDCNPRARSGAVVFYF